MFSTMFSSFYDFDIREDYHYSIFDITPAEGNRPHNFSSIESGLSDFSTNWECIAEDDERRRGSDKLYLVNDAYYVWCSRTGMERAGNSIEFSSNSPEELRYSVVSAVFESICQKQFGEIEEGLSKEQLQSEGMSIVSPKEFVLAESCTEDELNEYYDELADKITSLLDKYYECENVEDIKEIIEWFNAERKELFRDYSNFTPTIVSQAVPEVSPKNGWVLPENIDEGKSIVVLLQEDFVMEDDGINQHVIEITEQESMKEVTLIHEQGENEEKLRTEEYDTKEELIRYIDEFMEYPED